MLPQVFIITPRLKEINHSPQAAFFENLSPSRNGGRAENYGAEKMTKIKLVRVLATIFVKSYHLYNLHFFGFCFAVP